MAKFLIQSVFALPNELVLAGIVQDGSITIGMKSKGFLEDMTVKSIEQSNKKIPSASAGMNAGLHVNRLKSMKNESSLFNKIIEFS